jgi:RNA polymerase sigma factor (sigma-70 family)
MLKPSESVGAPESFREGTHTFIFKHGTPAAEIDSKIWIAYRSGSREALDLLMEKHSRLLFTYASRMTKDHFLVEDCVQDVFVELWNKRDVVSETNNVQLYLLKCLRRKIIRALAIQKRIPYQSLDEDACENLLEFSTEFRMIQDEQHADRKRQLKDGLDQLSKRQREAVFLKFYHHFEYAEIAEAMNLTVKSTYKLIAKSIETLRQHIKIS